MTDLVEAYQERADAIKDAKARSLAARQKEEADVTRGKELREKSLLTLKEKKKASMPSPVELFEGRLFFSNISFSQRFYS